MSLTITDIVGANPNRVTPGTTTDGQNAEFALGTRAKGPNNTEFVYVQAAAALLAATTDPNALAIDENYQASLMTTALALNNYDLAFAPPQVIADNDFFWAVLKGSGFNARVAASAAADTYLRTTLTAGRLGTASTASAVTFTGVVIVAAASASTSANNSVRQVLAVSPRAVRQGVSTLIS
jgi:hypothetical protein